MNRIQTIPPVEELVFASDAPVGSQIESGHYAAIRGSHPTALFGPLHYEPNYAYPLLVWLHGAGDDESQLKRIMPLVSLRNYVGVAIRGTETASALSRAGYTWLQSRADVAVA